jgi:hypothetical protein
MWKSNNAACSSSVSDLVISEYVELQVSGTS